MLLASWATATVRLLQPVRNLLEYAALKLLSQRIGVAQIERRRDAVSIRFT